jgi:hypothetical protein
MTRRAIDLILIVVTLVGGVLAWQTGQERSRLAATYARLSRKAGDLPIGDPSKVHVMALPTGDPRHYAWRVYLPPKYSYELRSQTSGGQRSASDASEFIARVRFREDDQGQLQVYTRFGSGSSRGGLGGRPLAELLRGRWNKIAVEQLGAAGVVAIEPDGKAIVLKLTLPEDMQSEARQRLSVNDQERLVPRFFELEIGPPGL